MKKRLIEYHSIIKQLPAPLPAKKFIPEWYKQIPSFSNSNIQYGSNGGIVKSAKNCIPFLDSLMSGYIVQLAVDVVVTDYEGSKDNKLLKWNHPDFEPVGLRGKEPNESLPTPAGHTGQHFVWKTFNIFRTPSGYSSIVTHPFNRFDLPFTTLSGIIDTDSVIQEGNLPFYIKRDFTGVIEAGTPIYQVIPFKRESWTLRENEDLGDLANQTKFGVRAKNFGYYKNNLWKKKDFE